MSDNFFTKAHKKQLRLREQHNDFISRQAYRRGVIGAAAIAADFDNLSLHSHLISDIVLCKLNATKRNKPRANKAPSIKTIESRAFLSGFALVLAEVNRKRDQPSVIVEIMSEAGVTLSDLRKNLVDNYDFEEISLALHPPKPRHPRPTRPLAQRPRRKS